MRWPVWCARVSFFVVQHNSGGVTVSSLFWEGGGPEESLRPPVYWGKQRVPVIINTGLSTFAPVNLRREVHLGEIGDGVLKGVAGSSIDGLLGLHGCDHDRVVRRECLDVLFLRRERRAGGTERLDALAQAVLANGVDNLLAVPATTAPHQASVISTHPWQCATCCKGCALARAA